MHYHAFMNVQVIHDDHRYDKKYCLKLEPAIKKIFENWLKVALNDLISLELISHSSGSKIYQTLLLKIKFLFPAIN